MTEAVVAAPLAASSRQVEQTAWISRNDPIHLGEGVQLPIGHGGGNVPHLHGEEAAKAAALVAGFPRHDLGPGAFEEESRLTAQAQLPEGMAPLVEGDATSLQATAQAGDLEVVDQEVGQLPGTAPQAGGGRAEGRVHGLHHRRAGPRGDDDGLGVRKDPRRVLGHPPCLPGLPRVVGRLTAASLGLGEGDLAPKVAEQAHGVGRRVGEVVVAQARHEEGDVHVVRCRIGVVEPMLTAPWRRGPRGPGSPPGDARCVVRGGDPFP